MLHAGPNRYTIWDYWGAGIEQQQGIRFFAVTEGNPIDDGHLASFVYTASEQGDVVLNLINQNSRDINQESVYPILQSIIIHQVDPYVQQMMGTSGIFEASSALQQEQLLMPMDKIDETTNWLEDIWSEESEMCDIYTKQEWNEFVDAIRNSN